MAIFTVRLQKTAQGDLGLKSVCMCVRPVVDVPVTKTFLERSKRKWGISGCVNQDAWMHLPRHSIHFRWSTEHHSAGIVFYVVLLKENLKMTTKNFQ